MLSTMAMVLKAFVFIIIARLSKPKSTTHDFAQAIMKKLLKQKISYVRSVGCRYGVQRVLLNLPISARHGTARHNFAPKGFENGLGRQ